MPLTFNALQLMVRFSAFFAGFAPWREIPGRPIESRKDAKLTKVSVRFTRGLTPALASGISEKGPVSISPDASAFGSRNFKTRFGRHACF